MEQEPVDVMVTDIRMPVMSGDVLIERVASLYPDTVPLALSGHCSTDRAVAISSRGVRFLAKPCHGTALIAALTEVFVYRQRSIDQACAATSVAVQPDADAHKAMLVLAAAMVRGGLLDAADLPEAFRGNLFAALAGDTVGSLLQEYYEDEARATDDDLRRRLGF
jgi:CheY-like chemotaxis protein